MRMENANRYVSERVVSEVLDVALSTLRNWRFKKCGPPYLKIGRAVRYDLNEVIRFAESKKIRTESPG